MVTVASSVTRLDRRGNWDRAVLGLSRGLKALPQRPQVGRHLVGCRAADEKGDEDLANAVALELNRDRQSRPGFAERLCGEVDSGPDGPVDTAQAPPLGWVDMRDFGHRRPVGEADAPGGEAPRPHPRTGPSRSAKHSQIAIGVTSMQERTTAPRPARLSRVDPADVPQSTTAAASAGDCWSSPVLAGRTSMSRSRIRLSAVTASPGTSYPQAFQKPGSR